MKFPPNFGENAGKLFENRCSRSKNEGIYASLYMSSICDDESAIGRLRMELQQFIPICCATEKIWQRYPLDDICGVSAFIPGSSNLQTKYHYDDLKWYHDVVEPYFQ